MIINYWEMTLPLPKKKVKNVFESFQEPKNNRIATDKTFWSFDLTIQAILSSRLKCRYLQQEQIKALQLKNSYQTTLTLAPLALDKLNNISLLSGRSPIQSPPKMAI